MQCPQCNKIHIDPQSFGKDIADFIQNFKYIDISNYCAICSKQVIKKAKIKGQEKQNESELVASNYLSNIPVMTCDFRILDLILHI